MKENKGKSDKLITIYSAARSFGIKVEVIRHHIDVGNIESVDGMVYESVGDKIKGQQEIYIGIKDFLKKYDSERFDSRYAKNRNKYIDFLENNDYFGIKIINSEDILFNLPEKESFYITKEDAQFLEYKSEQFFKEFGFTEKEKVEQIISGKSQDHKLSTDYLKKYLLYMEDEKNIYTASLTEFIRTILDMQDIKQLTDEDIISVIEDADTVKTKKLLKNFFEYVAKYEIVKYHNIELKKKENNSVPAYSYRDFVLLAKILFNADYDKKHNLTQKALENSKYIEMWMFLSCHYICAWRAIDICNSWVYPSIKDNDNPFDIRVNTLKEDILNGSISDETYEKVALYSIRRIEMAYNMPQKTGLGKLRAEIVPELRAFFGKLILIAEYHHVTSGEGYMNAHRASIYRNWVICKNFFGDDIFSVTGKKSLSSRRLNKSYLQGLEQAAKNIGNTTLVAHVIASFARNHSNIDTTAIYLKDHGLTGESAEIVLYMMMQRGVFSVSLYSALIAAYPEAFEKLSAQEQTKIMKKIPLSAYELETISTAFTASDRVTEVFTEGKTEEPKEILRAMFSIGQGRGKGKDGGVYCKKKALGYACENPMYESCLANLCPYHVLTSDGIPALIKVIKDYQIKARTSSDKKYSIALKTKIIPAFQNIINAIIKEMSDKDKAGIKKLIEEALNNG